MSPNSLIASPERISRRELLRRGMSVGAFMLPCVSAMAQTQRETRAKAAIIVLLEGGLSHLDSWDPKPSAPSEIRGEFGTIPTTIPGLRICEHMPLLARQAHIYNLVRSVQGAKEHEQGLHWVLTGYDKPNANTTTFRTNDEHPAQGSIVAYHQERLGTRGDLPAYVAIPNRTQLGGRSEFATAAGLGGGYEPLETGEPPITAKDPFKMPPSLMLARDISPDRLQDRRELLHAVEAGVTYVLVNFSINNSWDTHENNFKQLKDKLLPPMDRALSALLTDLDERGLLDDVLVMALGEMGRTPRINAKAGRDHWADAFSVMLAGGGLTRGQILGETTPTGDRPRHRPVRIEDLQMTVYHQLGIQPSTMRFDEQNRLLPTLPPGTPVHELIA